MNDFINLNTLSVDTIYQRLTPCCEICIWFVLTSNCVAAHAQMFQIQVYRCQNVAIETWIKAAKFS